MARQYLYKPMLALGVVYTLLNFKWQKVIAMHIVAVEQLHAEYEYGRLTSTLATTDLWI